MTDDELGTCSRCKIAPALTLSRKELFCASCFVRFVSGKQRRHMNSDKFKVKFGDNWKREKVIFPLSLGSSSIVLLDILLSQLNEQSKNPKVQVGFEIDVIYIDDSLVNEYKNDPTAIIRKIQTDYDTQRFPITFTVVKINDFLSADKKIQDLHLINDFTSYSANINIDNDVTVADILNNCPNRASSHDLQKIILDRMIMDYAYERGATTILWGHNMSSLAEEVLALTVKGRGSEIHIHLTDCSRDIKGSIIDIIHPLRDISAGEIERFVSFRALQAFLLIPVANPERLMNKQRTINEIVSSYYRAVDTDDDNIVSTVVRTGAKLAEPKNYDGVLCSICDRKIYNRPMDWLRAITYNGSRPPETPLEEELLQEWNESRAPETGKDLSTQAGYCEASLCYGCSVTVRTHGQTAFKWPLEKSQILSNFVIASDDDSE